MFLDWVSGEGDVRTLDHDGVTYFADKLGTCWLLIVEVPGVPTKGHSEFEHFVDVEDHVKQLITS